MIFAELKQQFDIYDVATNKLGLSLRKIGANQYRGVSPASGIHHTDDALAIDTSLQSWFDFSTGEYGDVIDLVAYVKSCSIIEAAKFLAGDDFDSVHWEKIQQQRDSFHYNVSQWHEALIKDEKTLKLDWAC